MRMTLWNQHHCGTINERNNGRPLIPNTFQRVLPSYKTVDFVQRKSLQCCNRERLTEFWGGAFVPMTCIQSLYVYTHCFWPNSLTDVPYVNTFHCKDVSLFVQPATHCLMHFSEWEGLNWQENERIYSRRAPNNLQGTSMCCVANPLLSAPMRSQLQGFSSNQQADVLRCNTPPKNDETETHSFPNGTLFPL